MNLTEDDHPTLYVLNWQGFVGLLPVGFRAAADRCYANGDQLPASIGKPTEGREEGGPKLFMRRSPVFTRWGTA